MRSFEELEIANWLCLNGIAYDYEPVYEHMLPDAGHKSYTPDFRLRDSGIYIEHFGVRKERDSSGQERLITAPYIDWENYLAGMEWKRKVHADHGTILIETFSYEKLEGCLTLSLAEKLKPHVSLQPIAAEQALDSLSKLGQVDSFTQVLATFLRHFKSSGLTISDCQARLPKLASPDRNLAFLHIFQRVFAAYQQQLGDRIDFEDMITRATRYVRDGLYRSPYRHILVDEFQDISQGRADLVRALLAQHDDARLFAVGDDWQSIYRFAGSDIHLMRNFPAEFGGNFAGQPGVHECVDLGRTFRSLDRIALPARNFVLKNPDQIRKDVSPAGKAAGAAIRVVWARKAKDAAALGRILQQLAAEAEADGRRRSVMLLGRYRNVRPHGLHALSQRFSGLDITFSTIHGAKGLEADHVILLRAESGRLGFPSEFVDDPLLNLVLPSPERFGHAEERRVFYVALTRARHSVTILAPPDHPSVFVKELVAGADYAIEVRSDGESGESGGHILQHRSA